MKRRAKLRQQVLDTIRRHEMFKPGDRVGVAVSGGADSVALLSLLRGLVSELGVTLVVLHFNHVLRGADSDADEAFVAALADATGLDIVAKRGDVAAAARAHGWNLEDAARRLRYAFFEGVVKEGRATRVAVAHTADDQTETVLARIIRGTGLSGLGGIYPVVENVVRPLIDVRRRELREYLESRGQAWREDASNLDTQRLRARLRHQLIPELARDFSPAITERLNELARLARDEEQFWNALVEHQFRNHATPKPDGMSIPVAALLSPLGIAAESERALSQRLVRRILEEMRGHLKGVTAKHVDDVLHLASQSMSGRRITLPGLVVSREFNTLLITTASKEQHAGGEGGTHEAGSAYEYVIELPANGSATIAVPALARRFHLKKIDWPLSERDTKRVGEALDADRLRSPLILRNWRPGDAYCPRGRGRVEKLKRLFLHKRIAVRERAQWPVLTSDGKLVWARGLPVAEGFAAGAGTKTGLVIDEERL